MSKTKHTTHFDDCGCKSLKYEQQLSAEKEKVRKLVEALNFCASYKNTLHIERVMENERCCCTSCHAEKILSEVEAEK